MRISWTVPALRDVEEIEDFVARESPAAAYRLVTDILDRTQLLLSENPNLGRPGRVVGTRELVLPRTRYIIVYRLHDHVEILAVIHGARQ